VPEGVPVVVLQVILAGQLPVGEEVAELPVVEGAVVGRSWDEALGHTTYRRTPATNPDPEIRRSSRSPSPPILLVPERD
jgi:hypothetical protein